MHGGFLSSLPFVFNETHEKECLLLRNLEKTPPNAKRLVLILILKLKDFLGFPWRSSGEDSTLPLQRLRVQSRSGS